MILTFSQMQHLHCHPHFQDYYHHRHSHRPHQENTSDK